MSALQTRKHPVPVFSLFPGAIVLTLVILAGCASSSPIVRPPQPLSAEPAGITPAERVRIQEEAVGQILLAREQARLGLTEEAAAAWDRAIGLLSPLAAQDEGAADRLKAVELERDRALADAALHDGVAGEELASDRDVILEGPEPPLDPALAEEVGRVVQEITPDYPLQTNQNVVAWIEAMTSGRLRNWFLRSLERSGAFTDRFKQIFAEEGLPQDLVYLAHVESAFQPQATSRAKARGVFQFIAGTGRRYGLAIDNFVDERADPEKSCRASAAYLRDLYAEFGDWNLALAAYNAGEGRVRQAIARSGRKDFWYFAERGLLPRETRNYVPAIQAATYVSKNPARFGLTDIAFAAPWQFETVEVPTATDLQTLATCARTDVATLRQLNPEIRRGLTPPGAGNYRLRVPPGHAAGFAEALAQIPPEQRVAQLEHRVSRGETLNSIARRYGTSTAAIKEANGLGRRSTLRSGQVLVIPRGLSGLDRMGGEAEDAVAASGRGTYRIRPGDTLGSIARKHGVSVEQLRGWNGLSASGKIIAGKTLKVNRESGTRTASTRGASRSAPAAARGLNGRTAVHTVKPGESAWKIAQKYGVTLDALMAANGSALKRPLRVGQKVSVPQVSSLAEAREVRPARQATVHVVRKGETLFRIAQRYGVTVRTLCALNNLAPTSVIQPGDTLKVNP